MADNVSITAGSGTTIATDDVGGGVQVQRVKATWGVDGTATDASATNPLPVQMSPLATNPLTEVSINFSSSGDNTVISASSASQTKVYKIFLVVAGSTTLTFKDSGISLTGAITMSGGGSIVLDFSGTPWFTCGISDAFIINSTSAVQVSGRVYYALG